MFKKLVFLCISFGLLLSVAYAGGSYTLSGNVTFQYEGNIYICPLTMEEFRDFTTPQHKLSESPCKIVQMNPNLKKAGKVSFRFENVPKGTYCVFAYQDLNMNGEVDFENFTINEPWGTYREPLPGAPPTWVKIGFDLNEDITEIEIHM